MNSKSQKGSVTIFVLIALLFYMAFLLLLYAANTNKIQDITKTTEILKNIYEKNVNDEGINNLYNKNTQVKVGDYVNYQPTQVQLTAESQLIQDLQNYAEANSTDNSEQTLQQEQLQWRVLDIKEDGTIRLISEAPTNSQIHLGNFQGYNNAVYLLDEACYTLYTGEYGTAKNLKIEDIENTLTYDYTQYPGYHEEVELTTNLNYPVIFEQEMSCKEIDGNTITGRLGPSQQEELINESTKNATNQLKVLKNYWEKELEVSDFSNSKYYELFIKDSQNSSFYTPYYLSSRAIFQWEDVSTEGIIGDTSSNELNFTIRNFNNGTVGGYKLALYNSSKSYSGMTEALRPVVTLKEGCYLVKDAATNTWNIHE